MQDTEENAHICYAVLRGKLNQQLFEEETQKMKILDITAKVRQSMKIQVLAYCVLDNELHLVLQANRLQDADNFLTRIIREYERRCLPNTGRISGTADAVHEGFPYLQQAGGPFRKSAVRELKDLRSAMRYCLKLHLMPVRRGIVQNPEDYWWCSYTDYMGRDWLPVTSTRQILDQFSHNPGQAARLIKKRHMQELEKEKHEN